MILCFNNLFFVLGCVDTNIGNEYFLEIDFKVSIISLTSFLLSTVSASKTY